MKPVSCFQNSHPPLSRGKEEGDTAIKINRRPTIVKDRSISCCKTSLQIANRGGEVTFFRVCEPLETIQKNNGIFKSLDVEENSLFTLSFDLTLAQQRALSSLVSICSNCSWPVGVSAVKHYLATEKISSNDALVELMYSIHLKWFSLLPGAYRVKRTLTAMPCCSVLFVCL